MLLNSASPAPNREQDRRLESWKEISAYLNRDERTAKRWEKSRGLPVHRLPGVRSGVFAFTHEIDAWREPDSASVGPDSVEEPEVSPPAPPLRAEPLDHPPATAEAAATVPTFAPGSLRRPPSRFSRIGFVAAAVALMVVGSLLLVAGRRPSHAAAETAASARPAGHQPSKEAEDLYLSGRYFWNKRTPENLKSALQLFQQATQRDPAYAEAYIGVADAYFLLVEYAALPPREGYPPAIAAARRAIELDSSLSEAHRALAFTSFYWNWDRQLSEQEFRKAIALDSRDATTHHWFANALMADRRYAEALAQIEEARKLDPSSISILLDREHILGFTQTSEQNLKELQQIEKIDPTFVLVHRYLALAYRTGGDERSYLTELNLVAQATQREADIEIYRAATRGFAAAGARGVSQALATAQLSLYNRDLTSAFDVAEAFAEAGDKPRAIVYLKLSYRNRDTQFITLKRATTFPMLKENSEFQKLADKSDRPYRDEAELAGLATLPEERP